MFCRLIITFFLFINFSFAVSKRWRGLLSSFGHPFFNSPAFNVILDDKLEALNVPFGVAVPSSTCGAAVSRPNSAKNGVLLRSPNASGEVSPIYIGDAKPVPGEMLEN